MQCRTANRPRQSAPSGSTPHDRAQAKNQKLARSGRRFSTGHAGARSNVQLPPSNSTIVHTVQYKAAIAYDLRHRKPTCWIVSSSIQHITRGTQIPITPAALPTCPFPRFPPLEVFGRRPRRAWPRHHGPASENLHKSEKAQTEQMSPALRPKADIPCVFMSTRLIARRENRFGGL